MVSIDYLEQKKTEIVADHVRRCHDTALTWAEQWLIKELNFKIDQLRKLKEENNG